MTCAHLEEDLQGKSICLLHSSSTSCWQPWRKERKQNCEAFSSFFALNYTAVPVSILMLLGLLGLFVFFPPVFDSIGFCAGKTVREKFPYGYEKISCHVLKQHRSISPCFKQSSLYFWETLLKRVCWFFLWEVFSSVQNGAAAAQLGLLHTLPPLCQRKCTKSWGKPRNKETTQYIYKNCFTLGYLHCVLGVVVLMPVRKYLLSCFVLGGKKEGIGFHLPL